MQITYEAVAINLAQYADRSPSEKSIPVLRAEEDLPTYTEDGWVVIGRATLTVDYFSQEQIQSQKLGALQQQLKTVRAENQKRENAILDQISKLQALTYESA